MDFHKLCLPYFNEDGEKLLDPADEIINFVSRKYKRGELNDNDLETFVYELSQAILRDIKAGDR